MLTPDPRAQMKQIMENMDPEELANLIAELNLRLSAEHNAQTQELGLEQFQDALTEAMLSGRYPELLAQVERTTASLEPEVLADRLLTELDLQLTPEEASELREQIVEHFVDTMMRTMMFRMNDEQFEEFKAVLRGDPEQVETGIMMLSARIPGLLPVMTEQMTKEYEGLKIVLRS